MSRQDKKERQRLKRKRRQQELHKRRNMSVFQSLAQKEGPIECDVNSNWRESGQASIMVLRPMPGGGNLCAIYLVDLWCCGLKEAFGRLNITRGEFEKRLKGPPSENFEMIPFDLATARRLVAGGMSLAVQNGFRLPHKADRWASIIGVSSYANADLSDFEKPNGKYRYIGSIPDLRKRLIGSVEDFLARKDIDYIIEAPRPAEMLDDADYEDEDNSEDDEFELDDEADPEEAERVRLAFQKAVDVVGGIRERGLKLVEDWVVEKGQTPHPLLNDAFVLTMMTVISAATSDSKSTAEIAVEEDAIQDHPDPQGLTEALDQLFEYINRDKPGAGLRNFLDLATVSADSDSTPAPAQLP